MATEDRDLWVGEVSRPMPMTPDTQIHARISVRKASCQVFITTSNRYEGSGALSAMGSYVFVMPNRASKHEPLSTTLCADEPTLEFAQSLGKKLAIKTNYPVYVGCSASVDNMALGGTVEERLGFLQAVFEMVVPRVAEHVEHKTNGL